MVKKAIKIFFKIILIILLVIIGLLVLLGVWNRICMLGEKKLLEDYPGQKVEIDGSNMNLYTEGEGEHTIVFLSGWGTTSPIYDFKALYSRLSDENRIVVIEKFGYGGSDLYDGDRDFDTILRQDREALEKLGIEGPYILCPHSLSGLEATLWAQKYPEEVEAIVGLDMTMADSYDFEADRKMMPVMIGASKVVRWSGLERVFMMLEPSEWLTEEEYKRWIAIDAVKFANSTVIRENDGEKAAWDEIKSMPLPTVPTIQYISAVNSGNELWVNAHQAIVDSSVNGKLIKLDCGHSVQDEEYERVAEDMKELIKGL